MLEASNVISSKSNESVNVVNSNILPVPSYLENSGLIDYSSLASLSHRMLMPSCLSPMLINYYPSRLALSTKISYRCSTCKRYLIKPSPIPRSIAFDKNSLAINFLPRMSIQFKRGLILGLTNPCSGKVDFVVTVENRSIFSFVSPFDVLQERMLSIFIYTYLR